MEDPKLLRKQYVAKSEIGDDDRTVTAIISTGAIDREQEILAPQGADFTQYEKNPVVLWAHDYRGEPIAKTNWIKVHPKQSPREIRAQMKFAETPKAEQIYQLFKGGYLNAFSVGFIPKEYHKPEPDEIKKKPELAEAKRIYDEWELLEFSAVPVPANPEALAVAVKAKSVSVSEDLQSELGIEAEKGDKQDIECREPICSLCDHHEDTDLKAAKDIKLSELIKMKPVPVVLHQHIDKGELAGNITKLVTGKVS